jgi:hypothetical protein
MMYSIINLNHRSGKGHVMAKIRVDLKGLDDNWHYIVNLNMDAIANAKVILNKPEFSTAKKLLSLSAITSAALATAATGFDIGSKIAIVAEGMNYLPDNSVPMLLQDLSRSGALKTAAITGYTGAVMAGVMSSAKALVSVIDKHITKHNPQIESARIEALVDAYGEVYELLRSENMKDGTHTIDKSYDQIRPIANALGQTSQKQKDSIFYSWMSKEFNHPMSPDDADSPQVIDQVKPY